MAVESLRAFTVKYIGATNNLGSRISITDERYQKRITIPYNYRFNNSVDNAINALNNRGIEIVGIAEYKNSYILLSSDFDTELKR